MLNYYAKRAFEILREEGPVELYKRSKEFLVNYPHRPLLELQKIRLKFKYGGSAPSPYNLIYINPHELSYRVWMPRVVADQHLLNISWPTTKYGTFIIAGGWDKEPQDEYRTKKQKLENFWMWESTVEYFEEGVEWENTSGFDGTNKGVTWFQPIKELHDIIQSDGYKTQRELEDGFNRNFMPPEYDEIRVNIGRNGEVFFDDGHHRFCALKILNVDTKIPVRVYVRHKQWQQLRDEIHNNGLPEGREVLRDHPDLQDILD